MQFNRIASPHLFASDRGGGSYGFRDPSPKDWATTHRDGIHLAALTGVPNGVQMLLSIPGFRPVNQIFTREWVGPEEHWVAVVPEPSRREKTKALLQSYKFLEELRQGRDQALVLPFVSALVIEDKAILGDTVGPRPLEPDEVAQLSNHQIHIAPRPAHSPLAERIPGMLNYDNVRAGKYRLLLREIDVHLYAHERSVSARNWRDFAAVSGSAVATPYHLFMRKALGAKVVLDGASGPQMRRDFAKAFGARMYVAVDRFSEFDQLLGAHGHIQQAIRDDLLCASARVENERMCPFFVNLDTEVVPDDRWHAYMAHEGARITPPGGIALTVNAPLISQYFDERGLLERVVPKGTPRGFGIYWKRPPPGRLLTQMEALLN